MENLGRKNVFYTFAAKTKIGFAGKTTDETNNSHTSQSHSTIDRLETSYWTQIHMYWEACTTIAVATTDVAGAGDVVVAAAAAVAIAIVVA